MRTVKLSFSISFLLFITSSCSENTLDLADTISNKELYNSLSNKSSRLASQISKNRHFLTMLSLSGELAKMPINYANALPTSQRVSFTNSVNALNSNSTKSTLLSTMGFDAQIFDQKINALKDEASGLANDIPSINQLTRYELITVLNDAKDLVPSNTLSFVCEIEHSVCQTGAFFELATELVVCSFDDPTLECYSQAAYNYLIATANCLGNWAQCEGWI